MGSRKRGASCPYQKKTNSSTDHLREGGSKGDSASPVPSTYHINPLTEDKWHTFVKLQTTFASKNSEAVSISPVQLGFLSLCYLVGVTEHKVLQWKRGKEWERGERVHLRWLVTFDRIHFKYLSIHLRQAWKWIPNSRTASQFTGHHSVAEITVYESHYTDPR